MELIFKFTKEELQLLVNALRVAVIHIDEDEKAEKVNNLLKILSVFQSVLETIEHETRSKNLE